MVPRCFAGWQTFFGVYYIDIFIDEISRRFIVSAMKKPVKGQD